MTADPVALAQEVREALERGHVGEGWHIGVRGEKTRCDRCERRDAGLAALDSLLALAEQYRQERDEARAIPPLVRQVLVKAQRMDMTQPPVTQAELRMAVDLLPENPSVFRSINGMAQLHDAEAALAAERVARETAERERDDWRDIARMRTAEVAAAEAAVCAAQKRAEAVVAAWERLGDCYENCGEYADHLDSAIDLLRAALASTGAGAKEEQK